MELTKVENLVSELEIQYETSNETLQQVCTEKEDKTSDARIGISERPQYIKQFSRSGKSNITKKKSSVLSSHRHPSSCSRRSVMLTIDEDEEIDLAPCSC